MLPSFCSSKNPYGNKTVFGYDNTGLLFCSSKNPYGNKTLRTSRMITEYRSVLAKILMVTKLKVDRKAVRLGSVLAKILMVTKPGSSAW